MSHYQRGGDKDGYSIQAELEDDIPMIWEEIEFAKMKVTLEARNKIEETQFSSCRDENTWRAFECALLIYQRKQKISIR